MRGTTFIHFKKTTLCLDESFRPLPTPLRRPWLSSMWHRIPISAPTLEDSLTNTTISSPLTIPEWNNSLYNPFTPLFFSGVMSSIGDDDVINSCRDLDIALKDALLQWASMIEVNRFVAIFTPCLISYDFLDSLNHSLSSSHHQSSLSPSETLTID